MKGFKGTCLFDAFKKSIFLFYIFWKYNISKVFSENFMKIWALFT